MTVLRGSRRDKGFPTPRGRGEREITALEAWLEKMKKLRWTMDGGFWDVDVSTPITVDGVARPVSGDPLPLGLTRGVRLSRPRQIDFFQRFMAMPFVPSFSPDRGFSLQRVFSFPFSECWFLTLLGQLNVQRLVSSIKENGSMQPSESSWLQKMGKHLQDKSLYTLNLCSELLVSPDDTMLIGVEANCADRKPRAKAVLHHKFPHHNLTVEAACPGLFVDQHGSYWDVPFTMAIDLASLSSESGASYHMCLNHNAGSPMELGTPSTSRAAPSLLPGLCAKSAISFKKNIDIWRSKAQKLKMVQPYDAFLSNPHVSASAIIGSVITACLGDNSARAQVEDEYKDFKRFSLRAKGPNSAFLADLFGSLSLSAQCGNFQRLFLDLTRFHARLDFPSGSNFVSAATHLAHDLYNSRTPSLEAVQAICPMATVSLQQQIAGPFSFRVDSGVTVDMKSRGGRFSLNDPVFAIEYALQVLVAAKAVAWYSPKQKQFMIELRFFET